MRLKNYKKKIIFIVLIGSLIGLFLGNGSFLRESLEKSKAIEKKVSAERSKAETQHKEEGSLKIGFITDVHCYGKWKKDETWETNWRCIKPMKKFIEQMNTSFKPDFVVQNGDLSDGRDDESIKSFKIAKEMMYELDTNSYHVLGNHEVQNIPREQWLDMVGYKKAYYAFDVKGYRIFVLDANYAPTNRTTRNPSSVIEISPETDNFYPGIVPRDQIDWLQQSLESAEDKKKIVFSHHPLLEKTLFKDRDRLVVNAKEVRNLFAKYKVNAVFSGHIEETCILIDQGVKYYTLPGFHKGNKHIKEQKDMAVFSQLEFDGDDLEVKVFQSDNKGGNFKEWILDENSTFCNNESVGNLR